ncbi:DgyrCDS3505 [Dimorphilus gyrociliatus]|uniref:DgyrCDS3505 n=1 Tax=Dimorphilus gyrociliatus TaxID=2664684 RepID=A0A7I8VG51_9ANNE|nr:DgyrCDS3505 [Dimorphilus gyrociliatus]
MSITYDFSGKTALVTGATKGIGRKICLALGEAKAKVYAIGRTEKELNELKAVNDGIVPLCVDLANWNETVSILEKLEPIHYLVNNAGVTHLEDFLSISKESVDKVLEVNVKAVINVSQQVAKRMIENNIDGSIVNVSSVASSRALDKHIAYCTSKGALDQVTRVMAIELGKHQIRVNSINPTVVMTDMGKKAWSDPTVSGPVLSRIPLGRFVELDDLVGPIFFLLSDSSKMINGAFLPIEGGLLVG